jgi:hypothetical protein
MLFANLPTQLPPARPQPAPVPAPDPAPAPVVTPQWERPLPAMDGVVLYPVYKGLCPLMCRAARGRLPPA